VPGCKGAKVPQRFPPYTDVFNLPSKDIFSSRIVIPNYIFTFVEDDRNTVCFFPLNDAVTLISPGLIAGNCF
jgi:hypothetical protein